MSRDIQIPTFDLPIGVDFDFDAIRLFDRRHVLSAAQLTGAAMEVKVYDVAYPSKSSTLATLTGAQKNGSSGANFVATLADTDTSGLSHGDDLWASIEMTAGGVIGRRAVKLKAVMV